MAHFRGTVQGNRAEASRLGGKASGIRVEAQSWQGKVVVRLAHNEETGKDEALVYLAAHHNNGAFPQIIIFEGPVDGSEVTNDQYAPFTSKHHTHALSL